jgi:dGTP triphosphohydrolase
MLRENFIYLIIEKYNMSLIEDIKNALKNKNIFNDNYQTIKLILMLRKFHLDLQGLKSNKLANNVYETISKFNGTKNITFLANQIGISRVSFYTYLNQLIRFELVILKKEENIAGKSTLPKTTNENFDTIYDKYTKCLTSLSIEEIQRIDHILIELGVYPGAEKSDFPKVTQKAKIIYKDLDSVSQMLRKIHNITKKNKIKNDVVEENTKKVQNDLNKLLKLLKETSTNKN